MAEPSNNKTTHMMTISKNMEQGRIMRPRMIKEQRRANALFVRDMILNSMRNQSTFTTGRSAQCSHVAGNASRSSKCSI